MQCFSSCKLWPPADHKINELHTEFSKNWNRILQKMLECKLFHKTLVYPICTLSNGHKVKCISSYGSQSKKFSHNVLYFSTKLSRNLLIFQLLKIEKSKYDFPKYFSLSKKIFTVTIKILQHVISIQIYFTITWIVIEHNWWLASKHLELSSSYWDIISLSFNNMMKTSTLQFLCDNRVLLYFHINRVNHRHLHIFP